jgi:hypothetical protein
MIPQPPHCVPVCVNSPELTSGLLQFLVKKGTGFGLVFVKGRVRCAQVQYRFPLDK